MAVATFTDPVVRMLGRVPLFRSLPRSDLERIAGLARPRELRAGQFLYRQGDPGDRCYLVERGEMEILRERPLGDHELLDVKRAGEAFGERSLLNDVPRSTSVRAAEAARLLEFDRHDFDRLLGPDSLAARLLRALARAYPSPEVRLGGRDPAIAGDAVRRFGRRVTRGLEPRSAPVTPGFQTAGGASRGENAPGRSLWDAVRSEDGRTVLALLAVKGSGVPPGYLIGVTRALLHEAARSTPFESLLSRLNSATFRNLFAGMDECVDTALFELQDGTLRWSCAGNAPTAVFRADGTLSRLAAHGPSLGILPSFGYGTDVVDLEPGDTLLSFSETSDRVLDGAAGLVRRESEPAELVRLLQAALPRAPETGGESDVAFVVVSRDPPVE